MHTLDHLILFADLVGSTDVACEMPIEAYAKTYMGSFHWAASKAFSLLKKAGPALSGTDARFKAKIVRKEWGIVGDQLTAITCLNGRTNEEKENLVACAVTFAYNLKLYWLLSPYNVCRLQNQQFPRDLAVGMHIGPAAMVSDSMTCAAGLHLSVAKRIESEARTGVESRVFASPDIVHFFNAWKDRVRAGGQHFSEAPPISSTMFCRREKAVDAKGIPKPLRVSELEWSEDVLGETCFWLRIAESDEALPKNVWDDVADAITDTGFSLRRGEFCFGGPHAKTHDDYGSDLVGLLLRKPETYVDKWFEAIASRPRIFADEAWLVLNTLFLTVALYRHARRPHTRLQKAKTNLQKVSDNHHRLVMKLLDDWRTLSHWGQNDLGNVTGDSAQRGRVH